ncbi:MAG: sugar ABC transporter substrate-binding protein [Synechococcales cyanobacterium CRU_2_2]|nr:sugar ABC transporter substrate-binding protein [Synechococcales cyanobacterium CRU_2_2]
MLTSTLLALPSAQLAQAATTRPVASRATASQPLASSSASTAAQAQHLAQLPNLSGVPGGEDYLLGPGDRVRIDFFNVPELSGELQVLPNGTINVPQIGAVNVRFRTLAQAENLISSRAAALLRYPVVTVSLLVARPITIAVAGEVSQPGSYSVATDNTAAATAVPTVTRMLKQAKGVNQAADISRVQIRRPNAQGNIQTITVNLWELQMRGDISQDIRLRDGDSVFVPASATIDLALARQLADADFASSPNKPLTISVVGEVNKPGPRTVTGDNFRDADGNVVGFRSPSITRAIQEAGGITQAADVRKITLRRLTRTGPIQQTTVNFWELLKQGGSTFQDLPLQDGDTIEVAKVDVINDSEAIDIASASFSPNEIEVNVAGEVVRPGPVKLKPNTPLNQALLAGGGYNDRAKTGQVTLLRLNPNGSVEQREIDIDLKAAANSEKNPPLKNGDTLVIARSRFSTATELFGRVLNPVSGGFGFFNLIRTLFFQTITTTRLDGFSLN